MGPGSGSRMHPDGARHRVHVRGDAQLPRRDLDDEVDERRVVARAAARSGSSGIGSFCARTPAPNAGDLGGERGHELGAARRGRVGDQRRGGHERAAVHGVERAHEARRRREPRPSAAASAPAMQEAAPQRAEETAAPRRDARSARRATRRRPLGDNGDMLCASVGPGPEPQPRRHHEERDDEADRAAQRPTRPRSRRPSKPQNASAEKPAAVVSAVAAIAGPRGAASRGSRRRRRPPPRYRGRGGAGTCPRPP